MNYYIIKLANHHLLDQIKADFPEDDLPFSYDPEDEDMNFIPNNLWKKSVTAEIKKIEKKLKEKSEAFFVYDLDREKISLLAVLQKAGQDDKKEIIKFLKESEIPGIIKDVQVIYLKDVKACISKAEGSPLYRNSSTYKKQNNLTFINQLVNVGKDSLQQLASDNRGFYLIEGLLNQSDKRKDWLAIGCFLGDRNYLNEMTRLRNEKSKDTKFMVPVHYLFQEKKSKARDHSILALSEKLYKVGRIRNPRLTIVAIANDKFDLAKLSAIFESVREGCLVIEFIGTGKELSQERLMDLYGLIRQYRHKVVTILCLDCFNNEENIAFQKVLNDLPWIIFDGKMEYNLVEANIILKDLAKRDDFNEQEAPRVQELSLKKEIKREEVENLYNKWYQEKALAVYECYHDIEQLPAINNPTLDSTKSAKEELEEMIGLAKAKEVLNRLLLKQRFDKEFGSRLKTKKKSNRHMIFMGNPGTAKTTVARLFARCLFEEGILKKGKLVECGRADLIGEYVGWTAKNVVKKFQEASGSILFIDEAYSLCEEKRGSFADEAINTLVQEMENHRDDVIVIFAGYKKEMKEFIKRNPGLSSRIPNVLEFEDYTPKELVEIAKLCAKENGRIIEEKAQEKLLKKLYQTPEVALNGNGRYIRNVIESAVDEQVKRILSLDKKDVTDTLLETLKNEDFSQMDYLNEDDLTAHEWKKTKEIGFKICAS